jgi:hypothetical protein
MKMIASRRTTKGVHEVSTSSICSILFISFASVLVARPAVGQSGCAGMWDVSIQTNNVISCNPGVGHRVLIDSRGVIGPDRPGHHYQVFGLVTGCRTIKFTVVRESEIATGSGAMLPDGTASGKWNVVSPPEKKNCSSTWSAQRSH